MTAATSTNTAITAATPSNTPIEDATALVKPLQGLLQGINLLGKTTAADLPPQTGADEDPGAQVFETNATAVARKVAPIVAALGGLTAIGSAVGSFANTSDDAVRIAALGSAGGVLVAVILGFAYIVGADLKSRTSGTVAIYEARKAITLQLLQKVLTPPQASETQGGADQGNSPTPLTSANAVIALAAAGAKAQTLRKTDQQVGHLAGIRCDDKVSVKWLDNDGKEYWSDPNDMTVESYTY